MLLVALEAYLVCSILFILDYLKPVKDMVSLNSPAISCGGATGVLGCCCLVCFSIMDMLCLNLFMLLGLETALLVVLTFFLPILSTD